MIRLYELSKFFVVNKFFNYIGELLDEAYEKLAERYSSDINTGLLKGIFRAGYADERYY
jgi:hypothetical protein